MPGRQPLFPWYKLSVRLGLARLYPIRERLRRKNLHDTAAVPSKPLPEPGPPPPRALVARTADGAYNDLDHPTMGRAKTRFGRNVPLEKTKVDDASLLDPSPREVSRELLTRDTFKPATILNLLAAAWIQFEVHDWFSHGSNDHTRTIDVPLAPDDPWPSADRVMPVERTRPDFTRLATADPTIPTFTNRETHWWDASQVYASDIETQLKLRSGVDGKLTLDAAGLLPEDPSHPGLDLTGVNGNYWVGLSLLHHLFALEHNALCDRFKQEFPSWSDDELFDKARLVNSALIAKIHTIEWTPGIMPHPTVKAAMFGNWYGIADRIYQHLGRIGKDILTGIPGSDTDHHAAPYAITEDFVAVYRMHPLVPDDLVFQSLDPGRQPESLEFPDIAGSRTRGVVTRFGLPDLFYSFGLLHPGAITLNNFPRHLQRLKQDGAPDLDLGTIDLLRDRERGVPRYNEFRRLFDMPAVKSFEALTTDPAVAARIKRVYGNDIEKVDLLVGLLAEPLPEGFGFSETAFRVFVLMASRRLKSDRFFTRDYRPEIYTKTGIDWIEQNTMGTVLRRHFPMLAPALEGVDNAFAPWKPVR